MDPVIHFELPASDLARAQKFYQACFGWELMTPPGGTYVFATTSPMDPGTMRPKEGGNINGGMLARQAPVMAPTIVIRTGDIERSLEAVKRSGGVPVGSKRDVGPGWSAYFRDPEGNVIGLFQDKPAK